MLPCRNGHACYRKLVDCECFPLWIEYIFQVHPLNTFISVHSSITDHFACSLKNHMNYKWIRSRKWQFLSRAMWYIFNGKGRQTIFLGIHQRTRYWHFTCTMAINIRVKIILYTHSSTPRENETHELYDMIYLINDFNFWCKFFRIFHPAKWLWKNVYKVIYFILCVTWWPFLFVRCIILMECLCA